MIDVRQSEHNVDVVALALLNAEADKKFDDLYELSFMEDVERFRKLARAAIDGLRINGK